MITPTKLELDLLHLYYNFADGVTGAVDMQAANHYAITHFALMLPDVEFTVTQSDIDLLAAHGRIPDVKSMLDKFSNTL